MMELKRVVILTDRLWWASVLKANTHFDWSSGQSSITSFQAETCDLLSIGFLKTVCASMKLVHFWVVEQFAVSAVLMVTVSIVVTKDKLQVFVNLSKTKLLIHCLTGLTDKMRADWDIMKDLSVHTRLSPEQREGRLNRFMSNIQK